MTINEGMTTRRVSDMTLVRIKCGECGLVATKYQRIDGVTIHLPVSLPADVLRRASSTAKCQTCGATAALFELAAVRA